MSINTQRTPTRKLLAFFKQRLVAPAAQDFDGFDADDAVELAALIKVNRLESLMHTLPAAGDRLPIGSDEREQYRAESFRRMLFGNHQLTQGCAFAQALAEASVPCLCMRGPFAALDLYGDSGIRHYNDLDLLVPRKQAMAAWQVAQKLGYELFTPGMPVRYFLRHHLHWQLRQPVQNVICDLHWAVEHPYRLYQINYDAIFAAAQPVSCEGRSWHEPAAHHHILLTAIHLRKHVDELWQLSQQPAGLEAVIARGELLHLLDLALLVQRHGGQLDWKQLLQEAQGWNACEALVGSMALMQEAFCLDLPEGWLAELERAIPAWQRNEAAQTMRIPLQGALLKFFGSLARKSGFRSEKLLDAHQFLSPPASYFGEQQGWSRSLLRRKHQFVASAKLVFAGLDALVANGFHCIWTRTHRRRMPTTPTGKSEL